MTNIRYVVGVMLLMTMMIMVLNIDSGEKYEDYDDVTICPLEALHEKGSPIKVLAEPPNCLIYIL